MLFVSFRLVESAPTRAYDYYGHESGYVGSGKRKLMAGAPTGKKTPKGKAKVGESARHLRLIALEELAIENDLLPSREDLEAIERDASLAADVTLWTYIHELVRRASFTSQGEAVRSLWTAMDKKEREKINADKVMKAHDKLVAALKATVSQAT